VALSADSLNTTDPTALPPSSSPELSVVVAAFNEQDNLPVLYENLRKVLDGAGLDWELITVDDHSADETFATVARLAECDHRVRGVRLSFNAGSHVATECGLSLARGRSICQIAADLQHPPEILLELWQRWKAGTQVVWAARARREYDNKISLLFSRLYYVLMRRVVGFRNMPAGGADFYLIDRKVVDAVLRCGDKNTSLLALIMWTGFSQETLYYDRPPRLRGRSRWTLEKKLKLVIDSVTAFTYVPIRLMSYVGLSVALLGFIYAAVLVYTGLKGNPVVGWTSLMVVLLVIGGIQMVMMGVLGEYIWRVLDQARNRPSYVIEQATPSALVPGKQA
jgi:dolichol-phosphate mannosyltransferase